MHSAAYCTVRPPSPRISAHAPPTPPLLLPVQGPTHGLFFDDLDATAESTAAAMPLTTFLPHDRKAPTVKTNANHPVPTRTRTATGHRPLPVPPGQVMDRLAMPADLSEPARRYWQALAPQLARSGALVPGDSELLRQLCEALALADAHRDALDLGMRRDPLFLAGQEARRLRTGWAVSMNVVKSLSDSLGVTPKGRAHLGLAAHPEETLQDVVAAAMAAEGLG
jgi:phage terminase small subunit